MIFCSVTGCSFLDHPNSVGNLSFSANITVSDLFFASLPRASPEAPTKEVLDKLPVHGDRPHVAEDDERGGDFPQAECLGRVGESVFWVERPGLDLAEELAVGEHGAGEGVGCPVLCRGGEDGGVEDVVVAEVGVAAGQGGVVLALLSLVGAE